jgi:hypothetical protein
MNLKQQESQKVFVNKRKYYEIKGYIGFAAVLSAMASSCINFTAFMFN